MNLEQIRSAILLRMWAFFRPKVDRIYYTNGGVGDELMLAAVAAAARRAGRPINIIATYPDLWKGNSDPASLQTGIERWHGAHKHRWIDAEIIHLEYSNSNGRHIADQMADNVGVNLPVGWRPVLALTPPPKARDPRLIVVQNSCSGARYSSPAKEWSQDRWRELARRLAGRYRLVQLGTKSDPLLESAEDLRGATTLREAAALLASAGLFVGLESGLQHLAAAVSTPAVIIYGGRSRPHETGYPFNRNITRSPECAGCRLNSVCPNNMVCMEISVDEVESAVNDMILSKNP